MDESTLNLLERVYRYIDLVIRTGGDLDGGEKLLTEIGAILRDNGRVADSVFDEGLTE